MNGKPKDATTAKLERFLENRDALQDDVGLLLSILANLPGKVNWQLIERDLKAPQCKKAVAEFIERDTP